MVLTEPGDILVQHSPNVTSRSVIFLGCGVWGLVWEAFCTQPVDNYVREREVGRYDARVVAVCLNIFGMFRLRLVSFARWRLRRTFYAAESIFESLVPLLQVVNLPPEGLNVGFGSLPPLPLRQSIPFSFLLELLRRQEMY